jgi:hypothetical protein
MSRDPKIVEAQAHVQAKIIAGEVTRPSDCEKCGSPAKLTYTFHPNLDDFDHFMFLCNKCYFTERPKSPRPPRKTIDGTNGKMTFEEMRHDLFVLKLTWSQMAEKYGLERSSIQMTWNRRCKRRGIPHRVPGMGNRRTARSAAANRANTDAKTISAVGLIQDIQECAKEFEMPYAQIIRRWTTNPTAIQRYTSMITGEGHTRPRLTFEEYDKITYAVATLKVEYDGYQQLKADARQRMIEVLRVARHRAISLHGIHRALGISQHRPRKFLYENEGRWSLDELRRLNALALEWGAWVREINEEKLNLRHQKYPKARRSPKSAEASVA